MLVFNKGTNTFTSSQFPSNIIHGFGTRMSGNGRETKNIQKYLISQKIQFKGIVDPVQVHGDRIAINPVSEVEENCDGLITDQPGVVLTVITADCAPIIYSDVKIHNIGISHNGRKGTEKKLAHKMVRQFLDLGSKIYDLRIAIGTAIGACCYPINLLKENVEQLLESGLNKDQIDFFPFCTKCDSKRFFSFRNSSNVPNFPEQFSFIAVQNI